MKKILILAYDFPPFNSIGAQRPASWFNYFFENGFYPVVVTRHWNENTKSPEDCILPSNNQITETEVNDSGTIIRVPFQPNLRDKIIIRYGMKKFTILRKGLTFILNTLKYYSSFLDNTYRIKKAAEAYINSEGTHFIIASGEPFILFRYASKLSAEYNIPWIADYRDGWSSNEHYKPSKINLIHKLNQFTEKRILSNVSLITTASPNYALGLKKINKMVNIFTVFNGYDDDIIDQAEECNENDEIIYIAYIGTLYPYQPIEIFLKGLKNFIINNDQVKIKVVFWGMNFYPDQKLRVLNFDPCLKEHLEFTDRVNKKELYRKLSKFHLFLLLGHPSVNALAAKVFDYLALNKKILFVIKDGGILEKLITRCNAGIITEDENDVYNELTALSIEFRKNGNLKNTSINYQNYSRRVQTKVLCEKIKSLNH